MNIRYKIIWIIVPIFVLAFAMGVSANTGVEIFPHIIDEKAKANDIIKYDIKLTNNTERKAGLYPVVNDMTSDGGLQEFTSPNNLDKQASLARWISISRGVVNIEPGAEVVIPLEIKVDMNAKQGKYYALVAFVQASNRYDAVEYIKTQKHPQVIVNLDIVEDIVEKSQIKIFNPQSNIFIKPPYILNLEVENTGNRDVHPSGRILIYDRRGSEVDELQIEGGTITPGQTLSINKEWRGGAMGKYKAKIMLEYGGVVRKDMNDTLFFWIFPYKWLIGVFGITLLLVSLLVFIIFRRTYKPVHKVGVAEPKEKDVVIKLNKKKNVPVKSKKSK